MPTTDQGVNPQGAEESPSPADQLGADDRVAMLEREVEAMRQREAERRQADIKRARENRTVAEQFTEAQIAKAPPEQQPAMRARFETWKLEQDRIAWEEDRKAREEELQAREGMTLNATRILYCEKLAAQHGYDPKELVDRVTRFNLTRVEDVDSLAKDLALALGAKSAAKPAIARSRTDSATGSGAGGRTYSEILTDFRTRQMNGEKIANPIVEARRAARAAGIEV